MVTVLSQGLQTWLGGPQPLEFPWETISMVFFSLYLVYRVP